MENNSNRVFYIDVLNVLSCFAVVCLHQNYIVHNFKPDFEWNISCIIENIFIFAVPVFFMISGGNLIGYHHRYSTKSFVRKRIKKTLIPFLLFSFFAYIFLLIRGKVEFQCNPFYYIYSLYMCDWMPVYWFFIPLFFIYLFLPVITYISELPRKKLVFLIVLLILICSMPWLNNFTEKPLSCSSNSLFGPFLYVLLGYYLKTATFTKTCRISVYVISFICLLLRCFVMWKYSWINGCTYYGINNLYYLTIVIPAIGVFLIIKESEEYIVSFMTLRKVVSILSPLSFGIYLIHNHIIYRG